MNRTHRMKISFATLLLTLTCSLFSLAEPTKTQREIDSILILAQRETDPNKLSYYYYTICEDYRLSYKNLESLRYAKKAYALVIDLKNDTLEHKIATRLAMVYFASEDYANSFKFFKKALALAEKLNDVKAQAISIFNIANLYGEIDDPINSQKYLVSALGLMKEKNIIHNVLTMAINQAMGNSWVKMNEFDSAKKYHQISLSIILKNKLTNQLPTQYLNLATLHLKMGDYKNCAKYLELMHEEEVKDNDFSKEALHLVYSANLSHISGDYKLAEKKARFAIQLATKNGNRGAIELASELLSKIKEKSNQTDSALYYLKLSQLYRDSLKGSTIKNLLQFSDTEMEEHESTVLDLKLKDQRKTMALLTGGVVMLAILLGVTYNFLRREKILKSSIESKNKEINEQNLKLLTQTNEMSSLMSEMEKILKEKSSQLNNYAFYNSHRLRAPIARIVGLGKLGKMTPTPEEKLFISSKICEVTEELDAMSKEGQRLLDES